MNKALIAVLLSAACSGSVDATIDADPDGGKLSPDASSTTPIPDAATAPADAPGGVGEPAALLGITLYHNEARQAESASLPPNQPPLPPLTWDPALAVIAADWAAKCVDIEPPIGLPDHNEDRSSTYPQYVGENIYGGPNPRAAVDLWMAERPNYNYQQNSCNGVCGHYTQIVWRNTTKVGCAVSNCPNLRFGNSIICNYAPGGNFGGQRPY